MRHTAHLATAQLALLATAVAAGTPQQWEFTLIARSSEQSGTPHGIDLDSFSMEGQHVALSDTGAVAIRIEAGDGAIHDAVLEAFVGGGSVISFLPMTNDDPDRPFSPHLAYEGTTIAAYQDFSGTSSPFSAQISVVDVFTPFITDTYTLDYLDYPVDTLSLAADGTIGLLTQIGLAGYSLTLIETGPPLAINSIVTTLDDGNQPIAFGAPRMNASETFVTVERYYSNSPPEPPRKLATYIEDDSPSGYTRTEIAAAGGGTDLIALRAAIADDGRVAALSRRTADGVWQLNRYDPGQPAPVLIGEIGTLPTPDTANGTAFRPALNADGLVAFRTPDGPDAGIFVGDGASTAVVAAPGDTVITDLGPLALGYNDGSTTRFANGAIDLNDRGQLAFTVWLENGDIALLLASPAEGGCNAADIAPAYGVIDLADLQAFTNGFSQNDPLTDLAPPTGTWDLNDVQAFIDAFLGGCP